MLKKCFIITLLHTTWKQVDHHMFLMLIFLFKLQKLHSCVIIYQYLETRGLVFSFYIAEHIFIIYL